jgi:hypothetical protein
LIVKAAALDPMRPTIRQFITKKMYEDYGHLAAPEGKSADMEAEIAGRLLAEHKGDKAAAVDVMRSLNPYPPERKARIISIIMGA